MRSFDLTVDVTEASDVGTAHTAVSVFLPDEIVGPLVVAFGFPGGGFGRKYYDVRMLATYSQAEYHVARGVAFVACDHLGVGDSSIPDLLGLTFENLAAVNHVCSVAVVDGLRRGTLLPGVAPVAISSVVAMGQSMGGCLLTVQQARHHSFDGVAFLGWSGIYTNFPAPDGSRITYPMPPRGTDLRPIADQILGVAPNEQQLRFCFHWPDEEPVLMEADLNSYRPFGSVVRGDEHTPWGSATIPVCAVTMMTAGVVATEAGVIDVPVLVGAGERDTIPDPWAEPSAYRASRDVSVVVVPQMSHMHNFARTRVVMWDRIHRFITGVDAAKATRSAL